MRQKIHLLTEMKKQMLKMGIKCEDGFIYFNELLYRCMRRQYGNFKLNKRMTFHEITIQFRLLRMRLNLQDQGKKIEDKTVVLN